MDNYKDNDLSEMLGLDCFKIQILKEINKSIEVIRKDLLTDYGWAYEVHNRYYDFYVSNMSKYHWKLDEKIKTDSNSLSKEQKSFLLKIPFIEFIETNISIKYNNIWLKVIQTKTHLILI